MKRFKVTVEYGGRAEAIVEAESEEDALDIGEAQAMQNIGIDRADTNIRGVVAEQIDGDEEGDQHEE